MHYLVQKNPDQVIIYHYYMHKEWRKRINYMEDLLFIQIVVVLLLSMAKDNIMKH